MIQDEIFKGYFLIATPEVDSGIFFRSVILICEHNSSGTLGLVVNKTLDLTLPSEILDLGEIQNPNMVICTSGPVQTNQLLLLHSSDEIPEHTLEVLKGVYLGGDLEFLQKAASDSSGPSLRLCFGYSGWSPGQLEKEIVSGSWFVTPATKAHVFETPPSNLWRDLLREMGGRYATLSMIPDNLSLN